MLIQKKSRYIMMRHHVNACSILPGHGLRTPNEGINQRNLKTWADVADKIWFSHTYQFGSGS